MLSLSGDLFYAEKVILLNYYLCFSLLCICLVLLGNEKTNQIDNITYLDTIIGKNGCCSKDIKSRISKA